ncbi:bifunctional diaminohydroxyphosphoribosylaminopyrimidine deaminase/5-amino-6-(5-phosphoribosylamino)uracil reductase RibD [cyanobiont of Ornithocercus magnificus]|nr:bifunctional diaminohydroxyphosphoribosylaminopyrimidine deaminase/5-amino-6-(5-phosphoribosylamino)uracil reductase RibD [cyanobiont of Ornithocercus magnificus]
MTGATAWIPWMQRALQLASLASGCTSPNPLVGAVVLDIDGHLVGEGFHASAGQPHAEAVALSQAGEAAYGGTLIVTLEPCCHYGRTPPCTELVLNAGIARVVAALQDPDPRVAGAGFSRLRDAGLDVIVGVLGTKAAYQNRAFIHRVQTGRPWGSLKWAMSLDGRTALPNGISQWITGPLARHWVHSLRAQCDAIIIGGGTLRADNPLLTSRGRCNPEPLRVVLSRHLDLPLSCQLWSNGVAPTLVAHGPEALLAQRQRLDQAGINRLELNACKPSALMQALASRGCNHVLWECGPLLATAALREDCVQEVIALIAPKLLGGTAACTPLDNFGFSSLDQTISLKSKAVSWIGKDLLLQLYQGNIPEL